MKNKIKVNQKVFVKDGNGVAEKIVNKVGRKYFYVKIGHWSEMKFSIETMEEFKDWGDKAKAYLNLSDIEDEKEAMKISGLIHNEFRYPSHNTYSIEQLRKVAEILNL